MAPTIVMCCSQNICCQPSKSCLQTTSSSSSKNSAPAHRARETVELLKRETPDFISPLQWPPNSPDLNPVDYKIWSVMQERVYKTRIRDVAHLRERLVEEWAAFDNGIVERAVQQWRGRLRACIKAEGGHFEYQMQ